MMDGQDAAMRGMLEFAEERYGRAIALDPGYAEAWNRRATIRFMLGDYVGSIADIREVLAREPRHFGALSGLGLCLMALDRPQEALEAFRGRAGDPPVHARTPRPCRGAAGTAGGRSDLTRARCGDGWTARVAAGAPLRGRCPRSRA